MPPAPRLTTLVEVVEATKDGVSLAEDLDTKVFPLLRPLLPGPVCALLTACPYGPAVLAAGLVLYKAYRFWADQKGDQKAEEEATKLAEQVAALADWKSGQQAANTALASFLAAKFDSGALPLELQGDALSLVANLILRQGEEIGERTSRIEAALGEPIVQEVAIAAALGGDDSTRARYADFARTLVSGCARTLSEVLEAVRQQTEPAVDLRLYFPEERGAADPTSTAGLRYTTPLVTTLIGRDQEMEELRRFRDEPVPEGKSGNVRWWLWYGNGGTGKSRLANEWLLRSTTRWQVGILKSKLPIDWRPKAPTLLVVDYVSRDPKSIADAIARLNRDDLEHPVRILLLDRRGHKDLPHLRALRGVGSATESTSLQGTEYATPRRLGDLQDEPSLVKLFDLAFYRASGKRTDKSGLDAVRGWLRSDQAREQGTRPLYLIASAIHAARLEKDGKDWRTDISAWRMGDLMDYLLDVEAERWRQEAITDADLNVTFYSTLVQGLDGDALPSGPCIEGYSEARCRHATCHTDASGELPPLDPDILGGAFVAARLAGKLSPKDESGSTKRCSRQLLEIALQQGLEDEERAAFLALLAQDFRHRPEVFQVLAELGERLPQKVLQALALQSAQDGDVDALAVLQAEAGSEERIAEVAAAAAVGGELSEGSAVPSEKAVQVPEEEWDRILAIAAHSYSILGRVDLDAALLREADAFANRALSEWEGLMAKALPGPKARQCGLYCLHQAGGLAFRWGRIAEAGMLFGRQVGIARALESEMRTPAARRDLSVSLDNVAGVLEAQGDLPGALERYKESLEIRRALESETPTPEARRDLSISLSKVARALELQGDLPGALERYEESLKIARALESEMRTPEARRDLSVSLDDVGRVRVLSEQPGFRECFEEALGIKRGIEAELKTPDARRGLAITLDYMAFSFESERDLSRAQATYEESLEIRRNLASELRTPEARRDLAITLNSIGRVLASQLNFVGAWERFEESLAISRALAAEFPLHQQFREDLLAAEASFGAQEGMRSDPDPEPG